ncbi:MerR family transcriptional regulator [Crassaminicella profunda]|uniref:MerR family transcriptional regulator n=1 Tax=Crassaminicella profunda TaxID=1286698 RepID=UPI001CA77F80|nr:MerR family transcriptional regulator [Crassaminicella profunda]QZY53879.1 MerR family transcriptional regulator [Crassaminicella profunda]
MYTIGQFSKIGQVSKKMLRHYDAIALLKPEYTKPENGYRYYSKNQIKDIMMINKLKRYRFSLEEISEVLKKDDTNYLKNIMREKVLNLSEEIKNNQMLLKDMEEAFVHIEKGEDMMITNRKFDIVVDELKSITVLSIRRTISMTQIGSVIGEIFEKMYKNQISPDGEIMTIYYDEDFDPEYADIEVCIPISKSVQIEGLNTRTIKQGLYAHTVFVGAYSEIGEGYAALMDWIKENNYEVIGAPFDRYIKGPDTRCNPKDYITEIYFPVKKMS